MSRLQEIRKAAGLSQAGLAEKSGVSKKTIQNYEQGERDLNELLKRPAALARALGVSIEDFIERDLK